MSVATLPERPPESPTPPPTSYLQNGTTLRSWLLTTDHKRIAILYLLSISFFFAVGTVGAALVRIELTSPTGVFLTNSQYNRMFSMHGIVMIFLFLIPSIPTTFGNFLIPLMLGARDLAFPKLNLASWYVFNLGGLFVLTAILTGGIDTGWTFYTPYSSLYSNSSVTLAVVGIFIGGMSNIMTGLNFVVTIHTLRAPGLTWFRMPLFVWSMYATSVIQILATPVVAITLVLVAVERVFRVGFFSPELGGDPVLFEHFFWFYSHPAVYIMVLPAMGVVSEIMATFCQKRVFGYAYVAIASLAIAFFGFLVWGHHMFISSQSTASSYVFSLFSFLIAIPSAIKVFNWTGTMHKARIRLDTPLLYALGFIGLFTIGGLTGLFLATLGTDVNFTNTYFVVAHFHYVMVGGTMSVYLGAMHYWWPKMTGRVYPEFWGKISAAGIFLGFNLTFFPQFILGFLGMPRRYHNYDFAPQWQAYNVLSSAGASILGVAYVLPLIYLPWSLRFGKRASANPWHATTLEWTVPSPPPTHNFDVLPVVTEEAYDFTAMDVREQKESFREAAQTFERKE